MKIKASELRRMIQESVSTIVSEADPKVNAPGFNPRKVMMASHSDLPVELQMMVLVDRDLLGPLKNRQPPTNHESLKKIRDFIDKQLGSRKEELDSGPSQDDMTMEELQEMVVSTVKAVVEAKKAARAKNGKKQQQQPVVSATKPSTTKKQPPQGPSTKSLSGSSAKKS